MHAVRYWQPLPLPLSPLLPLPQLDGLTAVGFVVFGGSFFASTENVNSFGKPAIIISASKSRETVWISQSVNQTINLIYRLRGDSANRNPLR